MHIIEYTNVLHHSVSNLKSLQSKIYVLSRGKLIQYWSCRNIRICIKINICMNRSMIYTKSISYETLGPPMNVQQTYKESLHLTKLQTLYMSLMKEGAMKMIATICLTLFPMPTWPRFMSWKQAIPTTSIFRNYFQFLMRIQFEKFRTVT